MMHKDIPQNRQLTIQRAHFAEIALERGAEALQGGGGVELGDLKFHLLGDELAL